MCDLACKTKIIINGSNTVNFLTEVCYAVQRLPADTAITTSDEIIETLNKMEEDAAKVQRLLLEGIGYKGPLPKTLK